jgi:hypothetical protein
MTSVSAPDDVSCPNAEVYVDPQPHAQVVDCGVAGLFASTLPPGGEPDNRLEPDHVLGVVPFARRGSEIDPGRADGPSLALRPQPITTLSTRSAMGESPCRHGAITETSAVADTRRALQAERR